MRYAVRVVDELELGRDEVLRCWARGRDGGVGRHEDVARAARGR